MQTGNPSFQFLETALCQPDKVAIQSANFSIDYGQLAQLVTNMARHLVLHGVRRGSVVGVSTDDLVVVMGSVLATGLLGATWMADTGQPESRMTAGLALLIDSHADAQDRQPGAVLVDESWARPPGADRGLAFDGHSDPEDIFILSRTSGTTGTPKIVALSYRAVAGRIELNKARLDVRNSKISSLFPILAPALVSRYLSTLVVGGQIVSSPDPDYWVQAEVDLVFGSPSQFVSAMDGHKPRQRVPKAHLSGGVAPERLIRSLLESFEVVANGYGSTEASNCLSTEYTLQANGGLHRSTANKCCEIEIVDEGDHPLATGQEGIVRIRNNVLASGYRGKPELSFEVFRNGWFYPGDIGRWTEDGILEITGRTNDQYNLGGIKVAAALVDHAIQSVAGVRDAVSFLMPKEGFLPRLTAFVSLEPGFYQDEVLTAVRVELLRRGGQHLVPERFLIVDTPPRNERGKPDRAACVELVLRARMLRQSNRKPVSSVT